MISINFQMLLYTSLNYDVFIILVKTTQMFTLNYHHGWKVTTGPAPPQHDEVTPQGKRP